MSQLSRPFLLSSQGSDRATAYGFSNKSVTIAGKTHVVWTDAPAQTRGRTFDHATRQWGPTIPIGDGADNHNHPTLTVDAAQRLHLAFGPHGMWGIYPDRWPSGTFKHCTANEPNSLDTIGQSALIVGYNATYGYLLHTYSGIDCLVYRGGEKPHPLMFQRQRPGKGWESARPLMAQDIDPGYTHVGPVITSDHRGTLYVAGHFYSEQRGYSLGVAVLKSVDDGRTWTDLSGAAVETPILYESRFAVPHPPIEHNPYNWGVTCDSRGRLWILAGKQGSNGRYLPLSRWTGKGWETVDVGRFLPADRVPTDGSMTIDTADRIHVVIAASTAASSRTWHDPSTEVFYLASTDEGRQFSCQQISATDPAAPSWLPTISRPGPFHPVQTPVILFTHGPFSAEKVDTEVWAVLVE